MKNLMAKVGTYEKDGETKNRWTRVGVILENQHGEYALLDPEINLAGVLAKQNAMSDQPRTSVMVSIFDNDNQGSNKQSAQKPAAQQQPKQARS
jgi:hypothetical protein